MIRNIAGETEDDGLIQRFLPIVLRPATLGCDKPTPAFANEYDQLVGRLHKLTPASITPGNPFVSVAHPGRLRVTLQLDDAAQAIRRKLEEKHLELMALEGVNRKLAAHIGKYNGYFARLCIVWHAIENCSSGTLPMHISADTAQRVATFLHEFLLPHAFAFYAGVLGLADDHDRLTAVAGYILAHKLGQITNRDVQRGDRTMRGLTKRDTDPVFQQLEALGWVMGKPGPRPSDPPHWIVNPEVHTRFAARAAQEATRRACTRAIIAEATQAR